VKDGKMTVNPEGAEVVKLIFHMYGVEKKGTSVIARELRNRGIRSYSGNTNWAGSHIIKILRNEKYVGDLLQKKTYTPDYLTHAKKYNHGEEPMVALTDHHEPIIDRELWDIVQSELKKRNLHGELSSGHSNRYVFSGKIKCGECGCWYGSKVWHSNSKYKRTIWRCNHKYDGDHTCQTPHLTDEEIQAAFLRAANKLLATKAAVIANGRAMVEVLFSTAALEAEHDELLQETQVVSDLVQQCIYENAHVAQDQTEYQKRYDALTQRFEKAKSRLEAVAEEIHQRQTQRANYEAFLKAFEKLPDQLTEFALETWHSLVDFATVYSENDIRFTFKNGQEVRA
jgi:hypothetical protein